MVAVPRCLVGGAIRRKVPKAVLRDEWCINVPRGRARGECRQGNSFHPGIGGIPIDFVLSFGCHLSVGVRKWSPLRRADSSADEGIGAIGAAGAQDPYKVKVGGSNPSSPTIKTAGHRVVCPVAFSLPR